MKRIKLFLSNWGIHSFLLPAFFVLHNYMQYYGMVSATVALKTFAQIVAIVLVFFLLVYLVTKNRNRSFQVTTLTSFIFLFYGVIKDFISKTVGLPFFASYKILLPATLISMVLLYALIGKKRTFLKINLFENLLVLIFILTDVLGLITNRGESFLSSNLLAQKNRLDIYKLPKPAQRPDIYYLLFDGYPGQKMLDIMHFDNKSTDSSLQQRGFFVVANSISNYNRTVFSMASVLNFEYLKGFTNQTRLDPKLYTLSQATIKYALVPDVFNHLGYKMYNLSIFDLNNHKPIHKEDFLTLPEQRVLLYNTLPERLKADILWNFITGDYHIKWIEKIYQGRKEDIIEAAVTKRNYNNTIIDSLQVIPRVHDDAPRFVYAHVYLPHPPFFYKKNGDLNDLDFVTTEKSLLSKELFLSYLQYTNKVMLKVVDSIMLQSPTPPVIIIQSDHGFRDFEGGPTLPYFFFKNYAAWYFPDKNYSMLYDSLSNINTFPILFNKYFNTHIAMKPDTSTFLPY